MQGMYRAYHLTQSPFGIGPRDGTVPASILLRHGWSMHVHTQWIKSQLSDVSVA